MTDTYTPHSLMYKMAKGAIHAWAKFLLPEGTVEAADSIADKGLDYVANQVHEHRLAEKDRLAAKEARKGS